MVVDFFGCTLDASITNILIPTLWVNIILSLNAKRWV
jgi:hypothetical protein